MKDLSALCSEDTLADSLLKPYPKAFLLLFKDQTTSKEDCQKNIIWATNDYANLGQGYESGSQILPELITGKHSGVIVSRVLKDRITLTDRVKEKAEVFTPSWICNTQNNLIDEAWFGKKDLFNSENKDHSWTINPEPIPFPTADGKTWQDYIRDTRLEITCGEAPYLVSRYDSATGEQIGKEYRIGMLDRKLRVVNENTNDSTNWLKWAKIAYQSVYGYEWQGDSLFIARENLLVTFIEYYYYKFQKMPQEKTLLNIVEIITWNLWQMDGLKGVIPNSCGSRAVSKTLFDPVEYEFCRGCLENDIRRHNGTYCYIREWKSNEKKDRIRFIDLIRRQ